MGRYGTDTDAVSSKWLRPHSQVAPDFARRTPLTKRARFAMTDLIDIVQLVDIR